MWGVAFSICLNCKTPSPTGLRACRVCIVQVDTAYAQTYTSLAVSKCFVGSPHIDTYDRAPQYALSLGDFHGGSLMVEAGPREVVAVDTHGRMAKVCCLLNVPQPQRLY